MPLYTYEDEDTGVTIDLRRDVEDRNKPIVLKRIKTVPDRIGVLVPGATEDNSFNTRMMREHHKKEEKEGSRFTSSFSKAQIKNAWAS